LGCPVAATHLGSHLGQPLTGPLLTGPLLTGKDARTAPGGSAVASKRQRQPPAFLSAVPREQRPQGTTDTEIRKPQANSHTHARMRAHTDTARRAAHGQRGAGPRQATSERGSTNQTVWSNRRMAEWMVVGQRPTDRLLDRSASQVLSGAAATGRQHRAEPQRAKPCSGGFRLAAAASLKGGDPAAGSPTATLLRLHPSR
jgi:hypothetical protein